MPIETAEDIAKLLRVELTAHRTIYTGTNFNVTATVMLDDAVEEAQIAEMFNMVTDPTNRAWYAHIDVRYGNLEKKDYPIGVVKTIMYNEVTEIFKPNGLTRVKMNLRPPNDLGELTIEGRVRAGGKDYKDVAWEPERTDSIKTHVLKLG